METPPPNYAQYPRGPVGGSGLGTRGPGVYFETIGEAFSMMFANAKVFVGGGAIAFGVFALFYVIFMVGIFSLTSAMNKSSDPGTFLLVMLGLYGIYFIGLFLMTVVSVGISVCTVEQLDTGSTSLATLFQTFKRFFPLLACMFFVGLLTGVGALLCFVPGLYLFGLFAFAPVLTVVENLGPIEAMQRSAEMLKPFAWMMALLLFVLMLLNMVGSAIIIGMVLTMPPYYMVIGMHYVYFRGPKKSAFQASAGYLQPPSLDQT